MSAPGGSGGWDTGCRHGIEDGVSGSTAETTSHHPPQLLSLPADSRLSPARPGLRNLAETGRVWSVGRFGLLAILIGGEGSSDERSELMLIVSVVLSNVAWRDGKLVERLCDNRRSILCGAGILALSSGSS
jgi:hypothetical protein